MLKIPRVLGDAWITISPDTSAFGAITAAKIKSAIAAINPNVRVNADTGGAVAGIANLRARLDALAKNLTNMQVGVDDRGALASIAGLQAKLLALARTIADITLEADTTKINAQIAAVQAKLAGLVLKASDVQIDANDAKIIAKIATVQAKLAGLELQGSSLQLDANDARVLAKIATVQARLAGLELKSSDLQIDANDALALAKIATVQAKLDTLKAEAADLELDANDAQAVYKIAAMELQLEGLLATLEKYRDALAEVDTANTAASTGRIKGRFASQSSISDLLAQATSSADLPSDTQLKALLAHIDAVEKELLVLNSTDWNIKIGADRAAVIRAIAATEADLAVLQSTAATIKLTADQTAIVKAIAVTRAELDVLQSHAATIKLTADQTAIVKAIAATRAELEVLTSAAANIKMSADNTAIVTAIAATRVELDALIEKAYNIRLGIDVSGLAAAAASLTALEDAAGKVNASMATSAARFALFDSTAARGGGIFGVLTTKVNLFGGVLGTLPFVSQISVWHLLTEAAIEFLAVVVPAGIALGAFGIGAAPTINDIGRAMRTTFNDSTALGQSIYPMSDSFKQLEKAVKPSVLNLFGDALVIVSGNMGGLQSLAVATGKVLDTLGTRITAALTGGGLQKFIANGPADLAKIGDIIGNIFGTVGNFLKVIPGYAEILLTALDDVTKAVENVTGSRLGQWLLGAGLWFHGFIVWAGLAVSGIALLGNALVGLGVKFGFLAADAVAIDFGGLIAGAGIVASAFGAMAVAIGGSLAGIDTEFTVSEAAAGIWEGVMVAVGAVNPLVWITAAVIAIGGLIYWLSRGGTAVNQFAQATQKALGNAPVNQLGLQLTQQYTTALQGLATWQKTSSQNGVSYVKSLNDQAAAVKLAAESQGKLTVAQAQALIGTFSYIGNVQKLATAQQNNAAVLPQLKTDLANYNTVLAAAGGNTSLLASAGITSNDILNATKQTLPGLVIQAKAAADAQNALSLGFGRAAAAANAQNNTFLQETVPAMKTVTDAEDNLLSLITSGESAFIGFQQSIIGTSAKFVSPTGLANAAKLAGGNLTGLSDQSLAFANTLYNISIPAAQKMITALQTQGANASQLQTVTATLAGEMLKYTGNNVAARTVIEDLINNALGPGTVNLQNMNTWVGKNATSIANMSGIVATVTTNVSKLSGVLQNQLSVMLAQVALQADGGKAALQKFADGVKAGDTTAAGLAKNGGAKVLAMFKQMYQNNIPQAKSAFIDWAANGLGLGITQADALWKELTQKTTPALTDSGKKAQDAATKIDNSFIKSLSQIMIKSPTVNQAIKDFSTDVLNLGNSNTKTQGARTRLINDLIAAGVQADTARQLVKNLQGQIDALHGKTLPIGLVASGSGKITAEQTITGSTQKVIGNLLFVARGGRVPGSGTGDTVPAMLTPGEVVVPRGMVAAGAVDHLRGRLPGFAAGGFVGIENQIANITPFTGQAGAYFATQADQAFAAAAQKALINAITAAVSNTYTPGAAAGGSAAAAQAFARSILPTGWSWPALLSLWNQECVPLRTMILTRRGWLNHDEVQVGDETIGYNLQTGASEWTHVTAVHHFGPSQTQRFGNKYWSVECTLNHRWLAESIRTRRPAPGGRNYVRVADGGTGSGTEYVGDEALVRLQDLRPKHRVILARKAHTSGTLEVSTKEAALLGWIAGDGTVQEAGPRKAFAYSVCQVKPQYFNTIGYACSADPNHHRYAPDRAGKVTWRLTAKYSRDLARRAGHPKRDAVAQVLAMSTEQRDAWLDAIICAEGTTANARISIYQPDGPVADAIELAIYLSGNRPSRNKDARADRVSWRIGETAPTIGGPGRCRFNEPAGQQPVWCVTTELGSWTARQDGQVFLTGNSGWNDNAVNPSSGAYGIPQALGKGHPYNLGDYANQVRWGISYIAGRYGDSQAAWAHEVAFNWYKEGGLVGGVYDKGGILPAGGWGFNGTGKAEMVTPNTGAGSLQEVAQLLRQNIAAVKENTHVTAAQGQSFARGLSGSAARGASMGRYGG